MALLSACTTLVSVVNGPQGYDTAPLTKAVHAFIEGGDVYTGKGAGDFLYPPSALLLLLPLGAVGVAWAGRLFFLVDLVTVIGATALLLRLFNLRSRGIAGAVAVFGISLAWPVIFTLAAGNVNGPVLLGLAGFLLATQRGRWTFAGVCLGLTLALKPILAPVLLVVVLYRRWTTLVTAVAIPVAVSAAILVAVPSTRSFFHTTLPLLLHGQNAQIQEASISLRSAAARLSIPDAATRGAQAVILLVTLGLLWRGWREISAEPRRLVDLTTIALVGGFLLSSFAFRHYGIFLLPFAVSLAERSSPHRNWIAGAALFCIAAKQGWVLEQLPQGINDVLAERFTLALLAMLFAFWLAFRREAAEQPVPLSTDSAVTPSVEAASPTTAGEARIG